MHHRGPRPSRCAAKLAYCSLRHDFATSSDTKIAKFTRPSVIGFVADLFFHSRNGLKYPDPLSTPPDACGRKPCPKRKVADSKISVYVCMGLSIVHRIIRGNRYL